MDRHFLSKRKQNGVQFPTPAAGSKCQGLHDSFARNKIGFNSLWVHLGKYYKYSFYGLQVELKNIIRELPKASNRRRKLLLKNKETIEKEINVREDPYYTPWKK